MNDIDPRMGAFDAVMYGVEGDPILRSVITLVVNLDKVPNKDVVSERIERMTLANPKLRQRAVGNPFSLLPPRWETDPNFDLSYHLRWERVPGKNAGMPQILELAERISEQDFDRARPLWEMHVVTGLARGKSAFIMKIHHSITDGMGGMQMAASLFELTSDFATDLGPMPDAPQARVLDAADRIEQGVEVEAKGLFKDAKSTTKYAASLMRKVVTDPGGAAVGGQEWVASASRLLAPASEPLSPLWTDRSLSVAFSVIEVPLDDLKAAAKAVKGTINDAFMAAVTGGLYLYHAAHGAVPDALRVNMPISVRALGDTSTGNQWVPARFAVPITVTDAKDRMKQLHPMLVQAREEPALPLSDVIYQLLTVLPKALTTSIAGGLMKGTDFAATNVPGPPIPVYFAGAKLESMIPFAPKGGAAVNVGLMSYDGTCFLGVNIDRGAVENPEELTDCLLQSLKSVLAVGVAS